MFKFQFQTNNPFEKRIQECNLISIKYPKRIPIICETHNNNLKLQKNKYLVPLDLTISQFMMVLRKQMKINPEESLIIYTENNYVLNGNMLFSYIASIYKNSDGFLYLIASKEAVFG
jgi:GABA(A) receptor-associated protein